MMLPLIPQGWSLPSAQECPRGAPGPMDSELLVDHNQAKAHPYLGRENNRDHARILQSPCGTIQTSFKLDFTLDSL
jgi:hypothetical protein